MKPEELRMQNGGTGRTLRAELSPELNRLTERVIGCAIDVHRTLGPGFLEALYAEALAMSFDEAGLRFGRELRVSVLYKGRSIGEHRLDLLVEDRVVVELKAVETLAKVHFAQVRSYLRATGLRVGILLNFESSILEIRRILNPDGRGG